MSLSSLLLRGSKKGRWEWENKNENLTFVSLIAEKRSIKRKASKRDKAMNGLSYATIKVNVEFKSQVTERELIAFKNFLKSRNQNHDNAIITIKDVKIVAIFLCCRELPKLFHKFYNLVKVDQLLRACVVYMQFYLQTCESLLKAKNQLKSKTDGKTPNESMKEDLDDLRILVGRFYAGIIFSELRSDKNDISKTDEILLFEYFLRVTAIVVWIALERKYFNVIKVELGRLFRTANFNHLNQNEELRLLKCIKKEDESVLIGKMGDQKKFQKKTNRLASTSPIIHNFIVLDNPELLMVGQNDFQTMRDERLRFLTRFIFEKETKIHEHGVVIGILGYHRRLFDPLLYPCSKRNLKLLVTGSPMDVSTERTRLREVAIEISQREHEPEMPHVFDHLPAIPKPNLNTNEDWEENGAEILEGKNDREDLFEVELHPEDKENCN